jgi:2-hydroxychromene-2-carboxylate isomerase
MKNNTGHSGRSIDWYFDFISPFAYLQHYQLTRNFPGISLNYIAVLFGALLQNHAHKGPAEIPAKRIVTYRHCHWMAGRNNIPFRFPPEHPFRPLPALRLAIALGSTPEVVERIFTSIWVEGRVPTQADVLQSLGSEFGLDDAGEAIQQESVKEKLRINTERAIDKGVFGVPTIAIGNEIFWGQDMTGLALEYLEHPDMFDNAEFKRLLDLPNGLPDLA